MLYVYIIQSQISGRYYIGSCEDVAVRLRKHNTGRIRSTKSGKPWKLVHSEKYTTRSQAYQRERQIKSYKGGQAFKRLLTAPPL